MTDQQVPPSERASLIVTLDGPAGSGKSTAARRLAARLGLAFLDTGAMYRGLTAACLDRGIVPGAAPDGVREVVRGVRLDFDWSADPPTMRVDGRDVMARLRDPEITRHVSDVAGMPDVREVLVTLQRRIGRDHGRIVSEGRDQGSVVFPDATVKFFLHASPEVRARRRAEELWGHGRRVSAVEVLEQIRARDRRDSDRAVGPLVRPEGCITVDSSDLTLEDVVDRLEGEVRQRAGDRL